MDEQQRRANLKRLGKFNYFAEQKQEFSRAFSVVTGRYVWYRLLPVLTASNADPLARRIRAHPNSIHWCVDVERCIGEGLHGRPDLMKEFFLYFVFQKALGTQPTQLTLAQTKMHSAIIQKCGREFMRIGLFPLWRYYKPKSEKRLKELEAAYREEQMAA